MKKTDIEILRVPTLPSDTLKRILIQNEIKRNEIYTSDGYFWEMNILYHTGKKNRVKKEKKVAVVEVSTKIERSALEASESVTEKITDYVG